MSHKYACVRIYPMETIYIKLFKGNSLIISQFKTSTSSADAEIIKINIRSSSIKIRNNKSLKFIISFIKYF